MEGRRETFGYSLDSARVNLILLEACRSPRAHQRQTKSESRHGCLERSTSPFQRWLKMPLGPLLPRSVWPSRLGLRTPIRGQDHEHHRARGFPFGSGSCRCLSSADRQGRFEEVMTASALPILDPREASDHLLDARAALQDVRDSSLPGDDLNRHVVNAMLAVDEALKLLAVLVARRVEQRRLDLEQFGETS